jgi:predicted permease
MSWFDRIRNHTRSNDLSREIEREMAFHLAERADDLVAHGMSAGAARHEARRRFGNVTAQRERTREVDLLGWLDALVGDLRYAVRMLRSAPAFTAVAILSLALGIGANTAIFSIVNAVMLKSLPVNHPEQLVSIERDKEASFTNPLWEALRDRQDVFSGIFAFSERDFNIANGGVARRISGDWVSGEYFSTLGLRPELGRLLTVSDDQPGCPGAVVISYGFWQSEFGGSPNVLQRTMWIDGRALPIVGVVDRRFDGMDVGSRSSLFVPLCAIEITQPNTSVLRNRSNWFLQVVGRPRPGITSAQITARLQALAPAMIAATIPADWPPRALESYRKAHFDVVGIEKGFSGLRDRYRPAFYILAAIVLLVLLVSCANVANLLLARATARQREIAVRLALGAARRRILRQLLTESLLLSVAGAVLGVFLAMLGARAIVALVSPSYSSIELDLSPDPRVLLFTLAVAVSTGLLFGVAPAWRIRRVRPLAAMKAQSRGVIEGKGRLARALVVSQVALSLLLVTAAILLVGSWRRLVRTDLGFQRENVLLVSAHIASLEIPPDGRDAFFRQILDRVRSIPGIRAASFSDITPVGRTRWNDALDVDGFAPTSRGDALAWANAITEDYFSVLRTPLLFGRTFNASDSRAAPPVAIVSEGMARHFYGVANVVGRTFRLNHGPKPAPAITIVGVVADTKYRSLRDTAAPIVYYPRAQQGADQEYAFFELRHDAPMESVVPAVRDAFAQADRRVELDITSLDQQLADSLTPLRAVSSLSGVFGALAVLLATIGLYGVMAYTVARRRNELGVRIALGAGQSRVMRLVLGDASRIVILGVIIGGGLSLGATKLVASFLYDVKPNDPLTLGGSAGILLLVGMTAAAIPAWRASRVDPMEALRE